MTLSRALGLLVLAVGALCGASARAETRRLAVIVGNNAGASGQAPLRYAETDAGKMAETLIEVGGVGANDLFLLQGRHRDAVREVFSQARARVAAWHAEPDVRVILVFYFSGHSDGEALELGAERLPFDQLRSWLTGTGAEVRLAIVDSCRSGALLEAKGAHRGAPFEIRLNEDLASSGEALLTSSAADELALESKEIRGSFFTNHLVTGLRGAADTSGDGLVTLTEAYEYAFAHTVAATASTLVGTQHPTYGYRLSGQGELVLSSLAHPPAALELPAGFDRIVVVRLLLDQVIAEVPAGATVRVAVPPGPYAIRAWRGGRLYSVRVNVTAGASRRVTREELDPTPAAEVRSKGAPQAALSDAPVDPTTSKLVIVAAGGVQGAASRAISVLGSVRLGLRSATPSGWSTAIDIATGRGAGYEETSAIAYAGYRLGIAGRVLGGFIGIEAGAGAVIQNVDHGGTAATATLVGAPGLGGTLKVGPRVLLTLEARVPVGWLRRDGGNALALFPAAWFGFIVRP
jgi:hypothetical protein